MAAALPSSSLPALSGSPHTLVVDFSFHAIPSSFFSGRRLLLWILFWHRLGHLIAATLCLLNTGSTLLETAVFVPVPLTSDHHQHILCWVRWEDFFPSFSHLHHIWVTIWDPTLIWFGGRIFFHFRFSPHSYSFFPRKGGSVRNWVYLHRFVLYVSVYLMYSLRMI
ncbi:hypothetical protein FB45DRAFT_433059 [Roridomyces roridus]|uniref:Uncharacterized protein n=1 Tax=Roridomyces roridus TaxID=1738132 RepID=A0AAD7FAC0_9AGAR|nr:hypothetical protein FB45DRAFT_433059 [Roridomyces roridus]